jgi:hypothetical protein
VALSVILELLAAGIQSSLERRSSRFAQQLAEVAAWLHEVSAPPHGAELRAPGGGMFTGIAIVSRNRIVASALLVHRDRHSARGPIAPSQWQHRDDESLWRRDDLYR